MKKIIPFFIFALFLISLSSAEIIINQQPKEFYSLGDTVAIPVTVKTLSPVSDSLRMYLICEGKSVNFYTNGISLNAGEEKAIEALLILNKENTGLLRGTCVIKIILKGDYVLTNEFQISDLIVINPKTEGTEFAPGQSTLIKGTAIKENGANANGFINLEIVSGNSSDNIVQLGTINNGFYSINVSFPQNMKAGNYLVKLDAYETDLEGLKTNKGFINYNIAIKQIPTSLEILFEETEVEPGTSVKVKAVLHDQTGEPIASSAIITIKKSTNEIQEQIEKATNEYLEYPIKYNEPPSNWTVVGVSNKLTSEANFIIKEKREIKVEIVNDTIIITNTGNVLYNDTILIKIGEESVHLNTSLKVDEIQKYALTAPDGEYQIEVISDGKSRLNENVFLTGRAINVKELKKGKFERIVTHPIVWIFIILVLGFIAFLIIKKGHKKTFLGRFHFKKKLKPKKVNTAWENRAVPIRKGSVIKSKNRAELSLSIKGNKQSASVVCVKVSNLEEIQSKRTNAEETLQKIVDLAEEKKAVTYENQNYLFFILAPEKTKTFKNERTALNIAEKTKQILLEHNKLFKQKIGFGISLNHGTIVAKKEGEMLKFMSMGTLMTNAKKIASISKEEVLLCEDIRGKLNEVAKTEKQQDRKTVYYTIKQMRHKEDHSKFIHNFLRRLEGEKKRE